MRFLRSIICAGLALAAMAVCAAMLAAASVPIDPGIHVMTQSKADYPAPGGHCRDGHRWYRLDA